MSRDCRGSSTVAHVPLSRSPPAVARVPAHAPSRSVSISMITCIPSFDQVLRYVFGAASVGGDAHGGAFRPLKLATVADQTGR